MYRIFVYLIKSFKWESLLDDLFTKTRKRDEVFKDFKNIEGLLTQTSPHEYMSAFGFFLTAYRKEENECIMTFINGVMRIVDELIKGYQGYHSYNIDTKTLFLMILDKSNKDLFGFIKYIADNKNGCGLEIMKYIFCVN